MRMRKKPHLAERMERCAAVWAREPAQLRGRWKELLPRAREIRLEIGCGKGKFTVETAALEPDVLFIGLERVADAMVMGMEAAMEQGLPNLFFAEGDAADLLNWFAPEEVDGIYLNFCDPWPSNQKRKRRLTYRDFLKKYRTVLRPGGWLRFRTDNTQLFAFSKIEFTAEGWRLENVTTDRHKDGPVGVMTGYEERFYAQGLPICALEAYTPLTPPAEPQTAQEGETDNDHQDPDRG